MKMLKKKEIVKEKIKLQLSEDVKKKKIAKETMKKKMKIRI